MAPRKTSKPPVNSSESSLAKLARERLTQLREKSKSSVGELSLFDFLVTVSPHLKKPKHLTPILKTLESLDSEPTSIAFSAPPRHGKSVLINHTVARALVRKPGIRVAWGAYNLDLAGFNSVEIKDILQSNGVELDRNNKSKEEWKLANGSTFKCVAPGSGFTGRGADLIIIDDPYKGRAEVESGRIRDATWSWFTAVAITRRSPNASVLVSHTRWTPDDLIGKLVSEHKWPYINLPAVNLKNEPLWPEEWPLAKLNEIKSIIGTYEWSSLYMGEPRPRGGAVFGDPTPVELSEFPKKFVRYSIGIDAAYTKKTHSDYSVAVVLGVDEQQTAYVLEVLRLQCELPVFGERLKALRAKYGSPPVYWYTGGIEKAVVDMIQTNHGVPIKAIPARDDKFVRAQDVAAAWNNGRVIMPSDELPWTRAFLSEVLSFTGLDDPHDDQVDALAAAYIPASRKRSVVGNLSSPVLAF